jgi:hypothetical protein
MGGKETSGLVGGDFSAARERKKNVQSQMTKAQRMPSAQCSKDFQASRCMRVGVLGRSKEGIFLPRENA